MSKVEFSDRYSATGIPYPDESSCDKCEGMGLFPCQATELNELACGTEDGTIIIIGQKGQDGSPMPNDGWLFVRCPVCKGSRKSPHKPNSKGYVK